jgi:Zn-dependent M28 family amino/carboxypeptidase
MHSPISAIEERLYHDVAFLTAIMPARNVYHPESLENAASYIESELRKANANPAQQTWQAGEQLYKNIIASYQPEKQNRLIIGAHYDVCGDQPGADDNASAVAGLLELARLLFENNPALDYRIDFVAYCLEEPPYFGTTDMGSYVHARSVYEEGTNVLGMISLEMIGYFSDAPGSQPFPSPELAKQYPDTANFIIVVGIEKFASFTNKIHQLMKQDAAIDVQVIHFPTGESLAGLSDQRNYWKFGYPALMVNDTAFIRNPNYHTQQDTIDTLDFPKMKAVVDAVYNALVNFK